MEKRTHRTPLEIIIDTVEELGDLSVFELTGCSLEELDRMTTEELAEKGSLAQLDEEARKRGGIVT